MISERLTFRLEKIDTDNELEEDEFSKKFVRSFGLKVESGVWGTIDLKSPVIDEFIKSSKYYIENGIARFRGLCSIEQQIIDNDTIEWYQIYNYTNSIETSDGYILSCKADRMSPTIHVVCGDGYNQFVSERFKKVVEYNSLTGLDFLWVKDTGKFKAAQWYFPLALKPLGRGIDHPWFDSKTLTGDVSFQPTSSKWRNGVWNFDAEQIKENPPFMSEIEKEIISLFEPGYLSIITYRSFLREYLPNVDFAYMWNSIGDMQLCVSKKGKEILLKSGVISKQDLVPIEILDELPDYAELLDGKGELPLPYFAPKEVERMKAVIEFEWKKHSMKEKPIKIIKPQDIIKMLKSAKRKNVADFNKPAKEQTISAVENIFPELLTEVYKISDGCYLNSECEMIKIKDLSEFNLEKNTYCKDMDDEYEIKYFHFASAPDGDWFSFDLNSDKDAEIKVYRITHEGGIVIEEWKTVVEFLYDMLTGYGDDE